MRAPFPYFGGKRLVASSIWRALGNPNSYVEPFAGSMAVLLARSGPPGREVVNDADGHVVNFWRAMQADPIRVWHHASDPVSELDVNARHKWLRVQHDLVDRLRKNPKYFDAQVAGWWVYGLSAWVGGTSNWCRPDRPLYQSIPRSMPCGVHSRSFDDLVWLARRLQNIHITCGDWKRVLTPAYLGPGIVGVVLDPPYSEGDDGLYANHDKTLSARVREWAIEHGSNQKLRIALCGYDTEHKLPRGWRVFAWKANGGFGNRRKHGAPNTNNQRERVWFSPHCEAVGRAL